MEVGQPGTPAPRAALEAVKRALDRETLGYTVALGLPALRAAHRPPLPRALRRRRRAGAGGGDDGLVGRLRAGLPGAVRRRAPRWRCPSPGYPCYRHILTALGPEARSRSRPMPPRAGCRPRPRSRRRPGARPSPGLVIASPANPTGTMLEPGAPRRDRRGVPAQRRVVRLRRDLPRPHLRHERGDGARPQRRGRRRQQLLQVLLDDGLARRLAGGAAGAGAPDRAPGAEPLHLAADGRAGGGASAPSTASRSSRPTSASTPRTARCCSMSCPRPASRASCPPTAPSISMSMSATSRPTASPSRKQMLADIGVAATPGDRLRRRARRRLRALLLCRHHRRHGRGRAAARGLEPPRASEMTGDLRRGAAPIYLQARAKAVHS